MPVTISHARGSLRWLQSLRGFSVLLVLIYHAASVVDLHLGGTPLAGWLKFGHSGVDIFFVISGFILFYIHATEFGRPEKTWSYLQKRFVRIYPLYWILTTAVLVPALLFPGVIKGYKLSAASILESYLLWPITYSGLPIIPPGWSLFHEIKFYLFFALLLLLKAPWYRVWLWIWAGMGVVSTAWIAFHPETFRHIWDYFWTGPYHLLFLAGCVAAWIAINRPFASSAARLLLTAGTILFGLIVAGDITNWLPRLTRILGYGAAAFLMISACVTMDKVPDMAKKAPQWLSRIGDASYSIYLVHFPVMFAAAKAASRIFDAPSGVGAQIVATALFAAMSLAVSVGVFHYVEVPLTRKLKPA
jgi:exopolysaccharide production protein ExoZ